MWPQLVTQFSSLITFSIKLYSEQCLEVIPAVPINEKLNRFGRFRYFLVDKKKKGKKTLHSSSGCHTRYASRQRHFIVLPTPFQHSSSPTNTLTSARFLWTSIAISVCGKWLFFFLRIWSKTWGWEKGHCRPVHPKDNVWNHTRRRDRRLGNYSSSLSLPPILLATLHESGKENDFTMDNNNYTYNLMSISIFTFDLYNDPVLVMLLWDSFFRWKNWDLATSPKEAETVIMLVLAEY